MAAAAPAAACVGACCWAASPLARRSAPTPAVAAVALEAVALEDDLQGPDEDLPRCVGAPHPSQQLKGELLRSICAHLGEGKGFLIFGNGYDSNFWMDSNSNGTTTFVEDVPAWVNIQPAQVQAATTLTNYSLAVEDSLAQVNNERLLRDFVQHRLPPRVKDRRWDVILVDGPMGEDPGGPGRGESIFAAASLADDAAYVYVDDCERPLEEAYVRRFFEERNWTKAVHDLDGNGGKACVMYRVEFQAWLALHLPKVQSWQDCAAPAEIDSQEDQLLPAFKKLTASG